MNNPNQIAMHQSLHEPKLAFHPDRAADSDIHPLRGLINFGPHSTSLVLDPIRVATVAPAGNSNDLRAFTDRLEAKYSPKERSDYLPEWPGFHSVFGVYVREASHYCHIKLSSEVETKVRGSSTPHLVLAEELVRAINRLQAHRSEFDLVVVYIPRRWAYAYTGAPDEDFDLHDHLKATTAAMGLPIQMVREDGALSYRCQASVMWRFGLALYVKAGGIPWKLAATDPEMAYIGISYAVRTTDSDKPRFVTCCSQVFDAEGAGLEFVAYDAHDVEVQRDNPFLSRVDMFRVMTRSIDLYRRRHAGQSPSRVMVHKNTEFKRNEIEGCMEAFHLCEAVDLVQIVEDVGWRGVRIDRPLGKAKRGNPAAFPVSRGTVLPLGPRDALLWTHGDVRDISEKGSYFKGSRSTPHPLRLVRHAGHGSWDDTARAVLGLSKMNWNNDSVYDSLPVTMSYAKVLARVFKRMPSLRRRPYQFRFFM
ncbi:MAG: hypothetical protein OXN17_11175 [Candidatus Poribacteria bacterium]|nr:hypothetical protein [Candidatus Poribacteria bacterium]MDE0504298.1 hypothetical protein [Candidatus Poribacteria bacterium]